METEKKQEVVIYGILWLVVLALVPVVMFFQGHSMGHAFRIGDVLRVWAGILPFFVLFLLHDLLIAPLWVEKGKPWAYLAVTVALLAVFGGYLWTPRQDPGPRRPEGPPMEWMEFVRSLEHPPLIVFTTAYSEYALEGFKVHAADYLLKPFSFQEFEASAAHLRDRIEAARPRAESRPEALTFKLDYKTVRVEPARIRYVESMSEYLKIWLRDEPAPLVVLYSLKRLAEQLPEDRFLRIHRSYLVNLTEIREYSRTSVTLDGGPTLPVGDIYRPALTAVLSGK